MSRARGSKMSFNRKIHLKAWVKKQMKNGVRQNKRTKTPAMTNYYGRIIKCK